ncbi:MAG: SPOR domain-containing protein [Rhodocyclales bacterium]|nr:SPOR domain-containing protein [Rhodocyclales bacterium]
MNAAPLPDAEATPADFRRKRLVNSVIVIALLVVGVLGSVAMLYQLYGTGDQAKPTSSAKPAAAAVESAASVAVAGAGRFALRLHAFSDVATAEELRAKLDALKIPSSISVEAKVQVGPFKSREEAEAARAKLKELGIYGGALVTLK